jgi:hypothetical protein
MLRPERPPWQPLPRAGGGNDQESRVYQPRVFDGKIIMSDEIERIHKEVFEANPAGRVRCKIMPIVKDYSRASQSFWFAGLTRGRA